MTKHMNKIKDPVCGMELKAKEIQNRSEHIGQTYYFCSAMCKEKFEKTPEQFTAKKVA